MSEGEQKDLIEEVKKQQKQKLTQEEMAATGNVSSYFLVWTHTSVETNVFVALL